LVVEAVAAMVPVAVAEVAAVDTATAASAGPLLLATGGRREGGEEASAGMVEMHDVARSAAKDRALD
jgi:hypothetical protein